MTQKEQPHASPHKAETVEITAEELTRIAGLDGIQPPKPKAPGPKSISGDVQEGTGI